MHQCINAAAAAAATAKPNQAVSPLIAPPRKQAKPSARRDLLLSIQKEQQKKWEDGKVFEAKAPAPGER